MIPSLLHERITRGLGDVDKRPSSWDWDRRRKVGGTINLPTMRTGIFGRETTTVPHWHHGKGNEGVPDL